MNDLEKFKEMIIGTDMKYKEYNSSKGEITLSFEYGYNGFFSQITFSVTGKLESIEAYE